MPKSGVPGALAVGVFTLLWFGVWGVLNVDPHHDGIMLKPALDVARGDVLFRDTFTQYGALTTLLQAGCCRIFGPYLVVLRLLTVAVYAVGAAFFFLVARKLLRPFYVGAALLLYFLLPEFYWTYLQPWSSAYSLTAFLVAMYLALLTAERPDSEVLWGTCGVCGAAAFWFRQPCGLLGAALLAVLIAQHWQFAESADRTRRKLWWFFGGATALSLPILGYIAVNGALPDFLIQSFGYAFNFAARRTGGASTFVRIFLGTDVFYTVLALGVVGVTVRVFGKKAKTAPDWQLVALTPPALVSLHQFYPAACPQHFWWAGVPGFIILAYLLQRAGELFPRWKFIFPLFLLLPLGQTIGKTLRANPLERLTGTVRFTAESPLRGMRMSRAEADYFQRYLDAVAALPERDRQRPVLNLSPDALDVTLFPNQRNWHPVYINTHREIYAGLPRGMAGMLYHGQVLVISIDDGPVTNYRLFRRLDAGKLRRSVFIHLPDPAVKFPATVSIPNLDRIIFAPRCVN